MAFCKLDDEYWAVNLESLGLDTLSNTETSKSCIISNRVLSRIFCLGGEVDPEKNFEPRGGRKKFF